VRYANASPHFTGSITVFHDGRAMRELSLNTSGDHEFAGKLGPVRIEIRDGMCRVTEASCPHRICIAHPPIVTPGQRITCVPNRISVVVG
jgi:hypothetical protein